MQRQRGKLAAGKARDVRAIRMTSAALGLRGQTGSCPQHVLQEGVQSDSEGPSLWHLFLSALWTLPPVSWCPPPLLPLPPVKGKEADGSDVWESTGRRLDWQNAKWHGPSSRWIEGDASIRRPTL